MEQHAGTRVADRRRNWRTLRRLQGDIAFAEGFIDGDRDSPDLPPPAPHDRSLAG
jgi:hypothetical protein